MKLKLFLSKFKFSASVLSLFTSFSGVPKEMLWLGHGVDRQGSLPSPERGPKISIGDRAGLDAENDARSGPRPIFFRPEFFFDGKSFNLLLNPHDLVNLKFPCSKTSLGSAVSDNADNTRDDAKNASSSGTMNIKYREIGTGICNEIFTLCKSRFLFFSPKQH